MIKTEWAKKQCYNALDEIDQNGFVQFKNFYTGTENTYRFNVEKQKIDAKPKEVDKMSMIELNAIIASNRLERQMKIQQQGEKAMKAAAASEKANERNKQVANADKEFKQNAQKIHANTSDNNQRVNVSSSAQTEMGFEELFKIADDYSCDVATVEDALKEARRRKISLDEVLNEWGLTKNNERQQITIVKDKGHGGR